MSAIDDILEKYRSMDPVQRQNFWYAVVGVIIIILLIISLGDSYNSIMTFLGRGGNFTRSVINDTANMMPPYT